MNQAQPPSEPLDATERELARLLRSLSGEPTAAQDARVLRMAANAAAVSRRPGARWLASAGAAWGIGGAAAAVLALGVGWQMKYGDSHPSPAPTAPVAISAQDSDGDAGTAVEFKDEPRTFEPPAPPAVAATAARSAPAPAAESIAASKPTAATASRASAQATNKAAADSAAPMAPVAFPQEPLDEHVARASAPPGPEAEASSAASMSGLASAKTSAQAPPEQANAQANLPREDTAFAQEGLAPVDENLTSKQWIVLIRELRDHGNIDEAKARLLEFHRRFPHMIVPSDLSPLLKP